MTAPRVVVDPDSGVAPWRQVRDQLTHLVRTGALPVGSRLPAIRQLAGDLGLAAGTVARVYRELEAAGVLRTARRAGT
ncbi:MAG: GntR family transcriptional regulator, partial [Actinophytocola sp.]|uniref:GntR family transcriptional regulator n=1 Tax=Actinophytocola sp. TaxID=1872138 RepID=UPI003D6AEEE3